MVGTNRHGQPVGQSVVGWSGRAEPARVTLRGRLVVLEPISREHAADLFTALCSSDDDSLWTYRPTPRPESRQAFDTLMEDLRRSASDVTFAVTPVAGTAAGMVTLTSGRPAHGTVEIAGVLWSRPLQRTAAATEAVHLLLRYVFDDLGYRRVEWKCDCLNEASRRSAERLGFSYEGRFRQHMITQGRNRDTDWFSLLDHEWPAVRARHQRWLGPENFDESGSQHRRLADFVE